MGPKGVGLASSRAMEKGGLMGSRFAFELSEMNLAYMLLDSGVELQSFRAVGEVALGVPASLREEEGMWILNRSLHST